VVVVFDGGKRTGNKEVNAIDGGTPFAVTAVAADW
jgi:hypothetical protein